MKLDMTIFLIEPFKREPKRTTGRRSSKHWRPSLVEEKFIRVAELWAVLLMYGSYVAAQEWVRRYRPWCEKNGQKYVRDEAIDKAAKIYGIPRDTLANAMSRSKRRQKSTAETR